MKYDITLKKIEDENSKLKAIATINIGDAFTVKGVKVYEGKDGLFVSMPNYRLSNWKDRERFSCWAGFDNT